MTDADVGPQRSGLRQQQAGTTTPKKQSVVTNADRPSTVSVHDAEAQIRQIAAQMAESMVRGADMQRSGERHIVQVLV
jgi:hypothetical protein